jgi:hypothetical protein
MVRIKEAEAFEWPPVEEAVTSQIFEFGNGRVEPTEHPFAPVASAAVAAPREADPAPKLPKPQQEEVHFDQQRVLQRASAAKPSVRAMRLSRSWSRLSSRVVPVALIAVAITAVLEGVYIVHGPSLRPTASTANSAQQAPPTREVPHPIGEPVFTLRTQERPTNTTEPAPERTAAVAPQSTAAPSPTSAANVDGARPRSETGRLVVRSDPSGAQVFVDGQLHGVTPLTLETMGTGEHRIVLKRYATELTQTVRIEPGGTVSVVAPMQSSAPAWGWMTIASPVELDVFENGALLGTSRSRRIMLEAGPHSLELVNENLAYRHTQQVRVEPGEAERITVALPQSTINLNARPWAEVWIDGESVGQTPIGNLPIVIGMHEIVFRHPELGEQTVSATIKAGIPTRLAADLRQQPSGSR